MDTVTGGTSEIERSHMNNSGITTNLDRAKIRKLLILGLVGSVMTGIGDFFLGFGEKLRTSNMAASVMANAVNLADWQLVAGGLLGMIGLFLEGLAFFAIYKLMADAAPKYARIYRASISGYIWLAPIGCHMNVGLLNMVYKYIYFLDPALAEKAAEPMIYWFCLPVWILLILFWLPGIIVQFKAFGEGKTPYPAYAKWFNLFVGSIPVLVISAIIGTNTALGCGIGTTFLSCGNALTFGGLLAALPDEKRFETFRKELVSREKQHE